MNRSLRDSAHLVRLVIVLMAAVGIFLAIRSAIIPKAFGQYGHYRPGALAEIRTHPVAYAGQGTCGACHEDQTKAHDAGKHAHVACEACHGPLAKHVEDFASVVPKLPETGTLCRQCHEQDASKPASFPQVVTAEHSGGTKCTECHQPHNPHL